MLTSRHLNILGILLREQKIYEIKKLAKDSDVSERVIRYDLDNINTYFCGKDFHKLIELSMGKVKLRDPEVLRNYLYKNYPKPQLSPKEREAYLLITIIFNDYINLSKEGDALDVSRTTVKSDLKSIKIALDEYNLKLELVPRKGLELKGEENKLRNFKVKTLVGYLKKYEAYQNKLKKYLEDIFILETIDQYLMEEDLENIKVYTSSLQKSLGKIISDEAYDVITAYIIICITRIKSNHQLERIENEKFLKSTAEYHEIKKEIGTLEKYFNIKFNDFEILKLTDYFLGSHTYNFSKSYYENWVEVEILVQKLIKKFSEVSGRDLTKDKLLSDALINHIKPTIYRVKNKLELQNSIYDEVKESYSKVLEFVRISVKPLEEFIGESLRNDELAYLVIHFKTSLDRKQKQLSTRKRILIVCGLGYGTSKLLEQQIKEEYNVEITGVIPYHLLEKTLKIKSVDLIITTLDINKKIDIAPPIIKVKPILGGEDFQKIDLYDLSKSRRRIELSALQEVTRRYLTGKSEEFFIEELKKLFGDLLVDTSKVEELSLNDLLKPENIEINVKVKTVEEALIKAGMILVKNGYVNKNYVKKMLDMSERFGLYTMLDGGIILPHAKNDGDVYKTSMSLINLIEPVKNKKGQEIEVVLAFSSIDGKEHLNPLIELTNLIGSYDFKNKIKLLTTPERVSLWIKEISSIL